MKHQQTTISTQVCLTNCDSNCVFFIEQLENDQILIQPFKNLRYETKLCPHIFASTQFLKNPSRITSPYYQVKKGSGKFKKISWSQAYSLIINNFITVINKYGNFLPISWHKGTANQSIANYIFDEFFYSIGKTTRILPTNTYSEATNQLDVEDLQSFTEMKQCDLLIIWGQNTAANYTVLMPYLMEVKAKGGTVLVIDPFFTKTANFSDFYLEIEPGKDHLLLENLIRYIKEKLENKVNLFSNKSGYTFPLEKLTSIFNILTKSKKVGHLVGTGIYKHATFNEFDQHLSHLNQLLNQIHISTIVFKRKKRLKLFNNQIQYHSDNRTITWNEILSSDNKVLKNIPIEFLWISGSNPLRQTANTKLIKQIFYEIPFIVTTDHFFTPTALMSNLVLPTTINLEELNMMINNIDYSIQLNEKIFEPSNDCKSEFSIINDLAVHFKNCLPNLSNFPTYLSEEDYLNLQWNSEINKLYHLNNVNDLREKKSLQKINYNYLRQNYVTKKSTNESDKSICLNKQERNVDFPFYLLTPHHPYLFNSNLPDMRTLANSESVAYINAKTAKNLDIEQNEIIEIYNSFTSIKIKMLTTPNIQKDTILIYNYLSPEEELSLNQVVTTDHYLSQENDRTISYPFYFDTYVNIEKVNKNSY